MPRPQRPLTSPRKLPVQARSTQLVADILQAAVRVLEREGGRRFTTIRVAQVAGVSVGSLYQYFPNKQAILVRLQRDEWEKTGATIDAILGDTRKHAAAPSYHDAPESRAKRRRRREIVKSFVAAAAPRASARQRSFAAELVFMTTTAIGKQLSECSPSDAEVDRWADSVAEMLTAHLAQLAPRNR